MKITIFQNQIFSLIFFLVISERVTAQTVISLSNERGEKSDSCYQISVGLSSAFPIAGVQFDLVDSWAAVKIDSVKGSERAKGFVAFTHRNRVLMYHPQGEAIAEGQGAIINLYLRLLSPRDGIDTLYFVAPPIVVSAAGEWILDAESRLGSIAVGKLTDAVDWSKKPSILVLSPNYPNPFNESTTFTYELNRTQPIRIKIYAINGQEIATVLDAVQSAGHQQFTYKACQLASGIYFYRIIGDDFDIIGKMILLR